MHGERCAHHLKFLLVVCRVALGVFALVSPLGCDFPQPPETVTVSDPPEIKPVKPSDITTPEDAMGAIMMISRKDLQLPAPDRIRLFLYKNSASFASYGQGWT